MYSLSAYGKGKFGTLEDLVARYARCHGPFTTADVARRYGLGPGVVAGALRRLAAQGRVGEGEFLPGGRGTEWCDSEVLRLLRRRCLARLRKEAEPVPPEVLGAFLPAWQSAGQPVHWPSFIRRSVIVFRLSVWRNRVSLAWLSR